MTRIKEVKQAVGNWLILLFLFVPLFVCGIFFIEFLRSKEEKINRCIAVRINAMLNGQDWPSCNHCKDMNFCNCIKGDLDELPTNFNPFVVIEAAQEFVRVHT